MGITEERGVLGVKAIEDEVVGAAGRLRVGFIVDKPRAGYSTASYFVESGYNNCGRWLRMVVLLC